MRNGGVLFYRQLKKLRKAMYVPVKYNLKLFKVSVNRYFLDKQAPSAILSLSIDEIEETWIY